MNTPALPADPREARAYLDRCHAWLMRLDLWDPEQERLFEKRGLQWIEMDRELRARGLTAGLLEQSKRNTAGTYSEAG